MSKKNGRWYESTKEVGVFQHIEYVYEDGSDNCWATGPTNKEAIIMIAIGIIVFAILLFIV